MAIGAPRLRRRQRRPARPRTPAIYEDQPAGPKPRHLLALGLQTAASRSALWDCDADVEVVHDALEHPQRHGAADSHCRRSRGELRWRQTTVTTVPCSDGTSGKKELLAPEHHPASGERAAASAEHRTHRIDALEFISSVRPGKALVRRLVW